LFDSSVALKWFLPEPDSTKAIAFRDGFIRKVHDLLAPDVFAVEAAHAPAKAERRGIIPPPVGSENLADLLEILPLLHPSIPLLPRAFEIASNARIGVYDCLYVALAEREGCELVTADQRLLNILRKDFPFFIDLASLAE